MPDQCLEPLHEPLHPVAYGHIVTYTQPIATKTRNDVMMAVHIRTINPGNDELMGDK